jgi:hypothetical protein
MMAVRAMPASMISRGSRHLRRAAGLVVVWLVLFAILGELGARLLVPAGVLTTVSNIYRATPESAVGYTLRPNLSTVAFGVPLRTNSLGFRGPEWTVAPTGRPRIALIGDSHAFGYGVPYEDSIGPRLARLLGPGAETLVFAAPGYGSVQERALVHEQVWRFAPDLLIVYGTANDADPPLVVDGDGYLHFEPDPARRDETTRVTDGFASQVLPAPGWLVRHSRLYLWIELTLARRRLRQREPVVPPSRPGWSTWMRPLRDAPVAPAAIASVVEPLDQIFREAKEHGVPALLITYAAEEDHRGMFAEAARRAEVPLLELVSVLPHVRSDEELVARYGLGWDGHPGAEAHRRFAEATARIIREQGWVK